MANERRRNRALSKDEDALHVPRTHQPAFPVLRETRQAPGQVLASTRRGSRYDIAEEKAVATPSPTQNVRRKSVTQPNGKDVCELPKLSPTAHWTPAAPPQPTSRVPARSRAGSRHDVAEMNPAAPAALVVNAPRKSSALAKYKDIIGIVKLLPSKQSSAPRDIPQQQPPRSRRESRYEVQANMPERQGNVQAQNDALGKRAPEAPVQNVTPPPIWPEKVVVQRGPCDWQSEADDPQKNAKWPFMLFAVAFLIGVVFLLLLFLVESSKKLASLERTTDTSPLTIPATRQEHKLIESGTSAVSVVPDATEHPTTTENEEGVDASTVIPTTVYGGSRERNTSIPGVNKSTY
ncbi:hypothetical protein MTO96_045778 [Rhipicephalus appendiculatus]